MSTRAFIVAAERYPQIQEQFAGNLAGTLKSALDFRQWLIEVKGVAKRDIFFCSEPRVAESTAGATRDEIRAALIALQNAGGGDTSELYFFFSGHGYAMTDDNRNAFTNALLASDYVDKYSGDRALDHDEIIYALRRVLGPGVHFHFVDVCRVARPADEFPVGDLALPKKARPTGQATVHVLYSTSLGDVATVNPAFGDALVAGLRGHARAKEWFTLPPRLLAVRFQSLIRYIGSRVRGQRPDPNPSDSGVGMIYEFARPIAMKSCTILVPNARPDQEFELLLADADQAQIATETFKGAQHVFQRLPNDYHVAVTADGAGIEPAGWVPVDLFEDDTKTFRVTDTPSASPPVILEASTLVNVKLPHAAIAELRSTVTGEAKQMTGTSSQSLAPGRYEIEVKDQDGWVVNRREIKVSGDRTYDIDFTQAPTPLHEEILSAVPGIHAGGAADLAEALGPLADQDPALWLGVMGAAQIVRWPENPRDFEKLSYQSLPPMTSVRPGASGLYLLVGLQEDAGQLQIGHSTADRPLPRQWISAGRVPDFSTLSVHTATKLPAPGLLSLALGKLSVVTMATAYLPNRATLITVTQDREGMLQVHQMMLPLGHLFNRLPPRVRDATYVGRSRARSVKFIVQAQRAFRQRQTIAAENQPLTNAWQELLHGKWLDPVMAALASYELLRRGTHGDLLEVAGNMNQYFPGLPDSGALARLLVGRVDFHSPSLDPVQRAAIDTGLSIRRGWPIFLDGLEAYSDELDSLPFPASRLDYRGMWTLWRGALPNPKK